jgi:hypothetical protein
MLVGVNIADPGCVRRRLLCIVEREMCLSFTGDLRRLVFWDPVLTRIRNHLSGWKSCFLSFGGRLVLLKFVLTSLPIYALDTVSYTIVKLRG